MKRAGNLWLAARGALIGATLTMFCSTSQAGSIFLTGHDPDFHASLGGNLTGARDINTTAIGYVMDSSFNPFVYDGAKVSVC